MAELKSSVVIEHPTTTESHKEKKSSYLKDSASRISTIAKQHGLDALLLSEKPQKTALDRALKRERDRKEQRQKNLEHIIQLAHVACHNETAGDPDQDWLYRFFDMAQDIHNSSMQRLWAQVLKREVTNPGFTSMKALTVLQSMTPKEAQILQRAATLACSFGSDTSLKVLFGLKINNGLFSLGKRNSTITLNIGSHQLPYSSLLVLIELGLLHATELESGEIELDPPLSFNYQNKHLTLNATSKGVHLLYYRFTPTGNELCRLLGNKPNMSYYDQLIALLGQKFVVHSDSANTIHHTV
ncbi:MULTISPECIES: TIGR03899 family protein [Vibrio]|uniref:TIGR03899 family protein n=1 Tax=Vibrio TaxID=662 RepID=UPI000C16E27C|nr:MULTISPECIES: TIGR03899 family protein [Vibrio]NAW67787.1 TIGR03899 family protein [Vibrio sp. V28_P6S34P95]NAX05714.1 TIGR03899 family protein [Vibrio sp. V30_P3S12P165]NAX35116.1 TIGR03899 family protein [Vibrio sp. V29_P1S30P107]NAX35943.1 TIGR03899 family protein [Vibrio sp. V27_P1S3P104]NAX41327.1 TIGR03899 family protein [Vibrio sp. V26_P1S5P106]